jgi:uncharacterized protein (DUF4213/DUF364 family)
MTLTSRLQQAILPGRILAVQVGYSRIAVLAETEDGVRCGLAATLSNKDFDHYNQPAVRQAGHLHELDYRELAALSESPSFTEVAIGIATINALLPRTPERWVELKAEDYLIQNSAGKNVALIGHFPFIQRLEPAVNHLWVLELNPRDGDLPAQAAPDIIPQADFVAITATTLINRTFDGIIALCRPDAVVVMIGPSTPLSPVLYDFGIDILSGTIVDDPQSTLLGISQGISLHQLRQAGYVRLVTMYKKG